MSIGLLGQKVGCTQLYTDTGEVIPVTVMQLGPCHVLQIRNNERDGYEAVQIGFGDKSRSRASKSERGHVALIESKRRKSLGAGVTLPARANCEPKKFVREFRIPSSDYEVGQELTVDVFNDVISVDVTAISKGSGYAGVMKRHNFAGQRASHGVKKCHRHLGSSGCSAFPSRTQKGKKMPGQYGADKVTIRNQKVVLVDKENSLLVIRGAVPGPKGGYVTIRPTNIQPVPKSNQWRITKKETVPKVEMVENVVSEVAKTEKE
ncbi:MAG: 50S ribosomal protein L3 [Planctomycetaceae bacterium]|jgi:large subunit ribosomal protein L3|nr:50S ribosomal protein L3 [Planctomycetaceae bacterium]